jgi:vitamin K-dependent gamma-carboxylase
MVREKNASVTYSVTDRATGRRWEVQPRDYLDARQEREFGTQPDLVWQLAQRIARDARARGLDVEVRADAIASLNGRPPARLVDPNVDLARVSDGLAPKAWIAPSPVGPPPHLVTARR